MPRTIWADWHGGGSYVGGGQESREVFPSINAAREAFYSRYRNGYAFRQTFNYADGRTESVLCPAVDETSEIRLYFGGPDQDYPDRVIKFGPRGGIIVERC
jgi:hypothetical protein